MKSKIKLTNLQTTIFFSQYGINKTLIYYGSQQQAKACLKYGYGVKTFRDAGTKKMSGFLPNGYHSIL